MALAGQCRPDEMTMLRARTRLSTAAKYLGDTVIPFVLPGVPDQDSAGCGYASHPWVISLYRAAWQWDEMTRWRHEITGLLLGYSPGAIARHRELDAGEPPCPGPDAAEVERQEPAADTPPGRDPTSTTSASTERAAQWDHDRRAPVSASRIGFTRDRRA